MQLQSNGDSFMGLCDATHNDTLDWQPDDSGNCSNEVGLARAKLHRRKATNVS